MTLWKKIKVFFVLQVLRFFSWLEYSDIAFRTLLRLVTIVLILATFFTGFYLESKESSFYRYAPGVASFRIQLKSSVPVKVKELPAPQISARSAIAMDVVSDKVLYELDKDGRYPPASTTKLMTALVAMDLYSLDETLATPSSCVGIDGSMIGLLLGEKMTVRDLLTSLLVSSANDSACVLSSGKITQSEFIELMNEKVGKLGLDNTRFENPIGFDSPENLHYSSSYDLYLLAKEAMKNEFIAETVKLGETTLKSGISPRKIYTTNHLLWAIPESYGIKTGKTLAAGEVLIYGYRLDQKDIIIVVMGSEERFIDTRYILDWVLETYSWN